MRLAPAGGLLALLAGFAAPAAAQQQSCNFSAAPGVVWWGSETSLPFDRIAAYLGPILWFSPDEPLLQRTRGADIRIPEAIPPESVPPRPVLYYQIDRVMTRPAAKGATAVQRGETPAASTLDLTKAAVFFISYFAHYSSEEGLGAHPHDIEPAEFRITILPHTWEGFSKWYPKGVRCARPTNVLVVTRVTAKAHALVWFWSVLEPDMDSRFPMHLLVEEGKHALATDKNGDGVFTPGYDVNKRINDAWGTRDNMRTGLMATGAYESWMAKVRRPEHRVFPPLPADSPLQRELRLITNDEPNAVYELRPLPPTSIAGDDHALHHLLEDKYDAAAPIEQSLSDAKAWAKSVEEGAVLKSLSIAFRVEEELGLVWVFPLLIFKHLQEPMTGGYLLHRMYLQGSSPKDFGWMLLYTPSASRWLDTYISMGGEHLVTADSLGTKDGRWDFVMETGLKFRVNMTYTPLKFLTVFTDYWGLRIGLKYRGFVDVNRVNYVLEFGAGSF